MYGSFQCQSQLDVTYTKFNKASGSLDSNVFIPIFKASSIMVSLYCPDSWFKLYIYIKLYTCALLLTFVSYRLIGFENIVYYLNHFLVVDHLMFVLIALEGLFLLLWFALLIWATRYVITFNPGFHIDYMCLKGFTSLEFLCFS